MRSFSDTAISGQRRADSQDVSGRLTAIGGAGGSHRVIGLNGDKRRRAVNERSLGARSSRLRAASDVGRTKVKTTFLALVAVMALALLPNSASAMTCSDYSTQVEAQRAADTRDTDGDGIYCESLPCPCATGNDSTSPPPAPAPGSRPKSSCSRPSAVQRLRFSATKYPNIKAHPGLCDREGLAADPRTQSAPRRRSPRPTAGEHPDTGGV
jgi:hypothetical protein